MLGFPKKVGAKAWDRAFGLTQLGKEDFESLGLRLASIAMHQSSGSGETHLPSRFSDSSSDSEDEGSTSDDLSSGGDHEEQMQFPIDQDQDFDSPEDVECDMSTLHGEFVSLVSWIESVAVANEGCFGPGLGDKTRSAGETLGMQRVDLDSIAACEVCIGLVSDGVEGAFLRALPTAVAGTGHGSSRAGGR